MHKITLTSLWPSCAKWLVHFFFKYQIDLSVFKYQIDLSAPPLKVVPRAHARPLSVSMPLQRNRLHVSHWRITNV